VAKACSDPLAPTLWSHPKLVEYFEFFAPPVPKHSLHPDLEGAQYSLALEYPLRFARLTRQLWLANFISFYCAFSGFWIKTCRLPCFRLKFDIWGKLLRELQKDLIYY